MAWEVVDTLRGTNGVDGTDGTDGSPGSSGADGNTVLYGASDPANGTGVNGNFYINTTAHTLFGPKASGTWPSGTSLIGPQGIQGIQGVAGNNGSNGTNGTNGADGNTILYGTGAPSNGLGTNGNFYIATNTNTIYGPKASGTWPAGTSLIGPQGPAGADGGAADVAAVTHAATSKTTPVDADELPLVDSAAGNVLKKLTWANLKAALLGSPTGTGTATWPALAASGLTGSTTTTRLVGANASGAPTTGAHNLYDVAVDGTGKLWICTTAGTPGTWTQVGGSSGAPADVKYITTATDATLSAEIAIPGLAGSPDRAGIGGGGITEEYDTTTTGLTWSTTPNVVDSNTTLASHLTLQNTNTGTSQFGYRTWTPSGAFDARTKVAMASTVNPSPTPGAAECQLFIGTTGHNSYARLGLYCDIQNLRFHVNAYTNNAGSFTQRGSTWPLGGINEVYLRIIRDASNNFTFYFSTCGKVWQQIATVAFTITVGEIGYVLYNPAAGTTDVVSDWLRTSV